MTGRGPNATAAGRVGAPPPWCLRGSDGAGEDRALARPLEVGVEFHAQVADEVPPHRRHHDPVRLHDHQAIGGVPLHPLEVLSVDWHTQAGEARRRLGRQQALQGNFDPCWLYAAPAEIRRRTRRMLLEMSGGPHIANLGHGILPDTPVAHARAFVDAVKDGGA
ncbi:MAG: hypothetical protein IPI92_12045 [Gemmatimonadetes bacterium]|nr:hypothetical protein [Gemmatimonadota bacterium]MBK9067141.1 hypothetical protein [Gemmatimonadota bacterium]